ncbi:Uncharacterized protein DAT39_000223, partial [Clarias magur]
MSTTNQYKVDHLYATMKHFNPERNSLLQDNKVVAQGLPPIIMDIESRLNA